MHKDYVPQSYPNLLAWLIKQETELTSALTTAIGMPAEERTAYLASVTAVKTKVAEIVDLMDTLEEKTADFPMIRDTHFPEIRTTVKRTKTRPGCTPAIVAQLDWEGPSQNFDPNTARPDFAAEAQRGRVKITGKKPGFDAVNIYFRKKGDVQWKIIAVRKQKFPYYDESPLAVANTPEVREYMAIGVIDDDEAGQPSEIHEVVYAG